MSICVHLWFPLLLFVRPSRQGNHDPFSIRLFPPDVRTSDGQRLGEIRVGLFTERFAVYPFSGTAGAVAAAWPDDLRRLLAGDVAVGLPTAIHMTWVLYRVGADVRVQQMLTMPGVGPTLTELGRVTNIPAYRSVNEDGERLSEWSTTVHAIREFLVA